MLTELTLAQAQQLLLRHVTPLPAETIQLAHALNRVTAQALWSSFDKPGFAQSSRDGFVIAAANPEEPSHSTHCFHILGEIGAGAVPGRPLRAGETYRIMTGAMVPPGATRVIPCEEVGEQGATIWVAAPLLDAPETYIRGQGSDLPAHSLLVGASTLLRPEHLLLLAEDGRSSLEVYRRPKVAVLCTGSELVDSAASLQPGCKISGNNILLASLLADIGAQCVCFPSRADDLEHISQGVAEALDCAADLIITTGGMGPGKYDLVAKVFHLLGGKLLYNRLHVRPGKATLAGFVEGKLFFALPGPPPAVQLLFHELVQPVVGKMKGLAASLPHQVRAELAQPLVLRKEGVLNLKAGVAALVGEQWQVRPAAKYEPLNAIILLSGEQRHYRAGTEIPLHLLRRWGDDFCFRGSLG